MLIPEALCSASASFCNSSFTCSAQDSVSGIRSWEEEEGEPAIGERAATPPESRAARGVRRAMSPYASGGSVAFRSSEEMKRETDGERARQER